MSYYERLAEGKGYFHFQRREVLYTHPHFHSAPEFLFVEKGEQLVTIGGETRLLKEGEACFSEGFCVHSYTQVQGTICHVILGERGYFEKQFSYRGKRPPRFFSFDDFSLLNGLRTLCEVRFEREENKIATFEGAMTILLSAISEKVPFEEKETDKQSALVCDILSYAESHLERDLSLSFLAKKFGYSHEHLSRLLHKQLAENWNVFIGRLRARKAHALLLQNPESSVLKIAYDCGFESPNTFYRAYKREYGSLPRRK